MRKMTQEELDVVVERHLHFLRKDCDGWHSMCADLSWTDLQGLNFNLANLSFAKLRSANLIGAILYRANLSGATLSYADLSEATLSGANLSGATLSYADLSEATLSGATLSGADFRNTDFKDVYTHGAIFNDTALSGARNLPYIPMVCPEEGAFIGWKKCGCTTVPGGKVIVKLQIPASAKRSSATGRKCRCDKAKVLAMYNVYGEPVTDVEAYSLAYHGFKYKVGKIVKPATFEENRWIECAGGIHFFMQRQEAIDYEY